MGKFRIRLLVVAKQTRKRRTINELLQKLHHLHVCIIACLQVLCEEERQPERQNVGRKAQGRKKRKNKRRVGGRSGNREKLRHYRATSVGRVCSLMTVYTIGVPGKGFTYIWVSVSGRIFTIRLCHDVSLSTSLFFSNRCGWKRRSISSLLRQRLIIK